MHIMKNQEAIFLNSQVTFQCFPNDMHLFILYKDTYQTESVSNVEIITNYIGVFSEKIKFVLSEIEESF